MTTVLDAKPGDSNSLKFIKRHLRISGKSSEKKRLLRRGERRDGDQTVQTGVIPHNVQQSNRHENLVLVKNKMLGAEEDRKTRSLKAPKARVWRAIVAEFIGTMVFVFFATGGVVRGLAFDPSGGIVVNLIVAFTQAFALMTAIYYAANISGGHINPAVTISFLFVGRMRFIVALLYIIAQLVGAIAGSALLKAVTFGDQQGNLGSTTIAEGFGEGRAFLLEFIMTFTLVSIVYATAIDKIGFGKNAPFAIGLTIFLDLILGFKLTGGSMNPARSFGPAVVSDTWDSNWVYWVGPISGALIAAWIYDFVMITRPANKNPFSAGTRMETEGRPVTLLPAETVTVTTSAPNIEILQSGAPSRTNSKTVIDVNRTPTMKRLPPTQ